MDATTVKHSNVKATGKLRDTETVMRSLEGGGWKSAYPGNSLATYPTRTPRSKREGRGIISPLDPTSKELNSRSPHSQY